MRNTTINSPKFVSTIAALSLCVSSAVADHQDTKWEIKGSNGGSSQSNHIGSSDTTTINNLESGNKITTKDTANGTISSLIIESGTNNSNSPILEVGNKDNNSIVNVPKITIAEGATLNRTIQNNSQDNNKWNIIFRGGSTIDNFENNGTIRSNNADTVYLLTDEKTKDGSSNGGQTVVRNFTNKGTIETIISGDDNAALKLQGAKIETFKNEKGGLFQRLEVRLQYRLGERDRMAMVEVLALLSMRERFQQEEMKFYSFTTQLSQALIIEELSKARKMELLYLTVKIPLSPISKTLES